MTYTPEETLLEEEMGFPFNVLNRGLRSADNALYGRRTKNDMKVDVQEHGNFYWIDVDLPGFGRDQIELVLDNGYLTVTAEKRLDREEKDSAGRWIHHERYDGELRRSFFVGDALTADDIKARYADGVLHMEIPKAPEKTLREPGRIRIEG